MEERPDLVEVAPRKDEARRHQRPRERRDPGRERIDVEGDPERDPVMRRPAAEPIDEVVVDGNLDIKTLQEWPGRRVYADKQSRIRKPLVKRLCPIWPFRAGEVELRYKKQKIILPMQDVILLPLVNTSTELLAEHVANQIRRQVRRIFPRTKIRYLEVGVEEARGQRGIYQNEF